MAEEGVRPILIIEVTSPKTRVLDVKTKVHQYAKAGVLYYVIANQRRKQGRRCLELISYRLDQGSYQKVTLEDRSRAWLEPLQLWLAVTVNVETGEDRLALIDPMNGSEIGDYTAIRQELQEALARARPKPRLVATPRPAPRPKPRLASTLRPAPRPKPRPALTPRPAPGRSPGPRQRRGPDHRDRRAPPPDGRGITPSSEARSPKARITSPIGS